MGLANGAVSFFMLCLWCHLSTWVACFASPTSSVSQATAPPAPLRRPNGGPNSAINSPGAKLLQWCEAQEGVQTSKLMCEDHEGEGVGLVAATALAQHECFLSFPLRMCIAPSAWEETQLGRRLKLEGLLSMEAIERGSEDDPWSLYPLFGRGERQLCLWMLLASREERAEGAQALDFLQLGVMQGSRAGLVDRECINEDREEEEEEEEEEEGSGRTTSDGPLYLWDRGEVERLLWSSPALLLLARDASRAVDGAYDTLDGLLTRSDVWRSYLRQDRERVGGGNNRDRASIGRSEFRRCWATVGSRLFAITGAPASSTAAAWPGYVVPVVDLMNHRPAVKATVTPSAEASEGGRAAGHSAGASLQFFNTETNSLDYHTCEAVEKGEKLCWTYGDLSNSDLLLHYGFTLPQPDTPKQAGGVGGGGHVGGSVVDGIDLLVGDSLMTDVVRLFRRDGECMALSAWEQQHTRGNRGGEGLHEASRAPLPPTQSEDNTQPPSMLKSVRVSCADTALPLALTEALCALLFDSEGRGGAPGGAVGGGEQEWGGDGVSLQSTGAEHRAGGGAAGERSELRTLVACLQRWLDVLLERNVCNCESLREGILLGTEGPSRTIPTSHQVNSSRSSSNVEEDGACCESAARGSLGSGLSGRSAVAVELRVRRGRRGVAGPSSSRRRRREREETALRALESEGRALRHAKHLSSLLLPHPP